MRKTEFDRLMSPKPRERKTKSAAEALASLMRLCARGERASGDARRLMATWGVPVEERDGVLQRLIADRFIDDRRYAEAYTREKSRLAGWGGRKIAAQLRTKGIDAAIIADVVSSLDEDRQAARLAEKLRRKRTTTKAATEYELRGKLLRYALSLGYDYDMAIEAVDKLLRSE